MKQHQVSKTQLVTSALILALTARTKAQSEKAVKLANSFAFGLTTAQLEACQSAAKQMSEGNIGGRGCASRPL